MGNRISYENLFEIIKNDYLNQNYLTTFYLSSFYLFSFFLRMQSQSLLGLQPFRHHDLVVVPLPLHFHFSSVSFSYEFFLYHFLLYAFYPFSFYGHLLVHNRRLPPEKKLIQLVNEFL